MERVREILASLEQDCRRAPWAQVRGLLAELAAKAEDIPGGGQASVQSALLAFCVQHGCFQEARKHLAWHGDLPADYYQVARLNNIGMAHCAMLSPACLPPLELAFAYSTKLAQPHLYRLVEDSGYRCRELAQYCIVSYNHAKVLLRLARAPSAGRLMQEAVALGRRLGLVLFLEPAHPELSEVRPLLCRPDDKDSEQSNILLEAEF
jgi:hypothetical protein